MVKKKTKLKNGKIRVEDVLEEEKKLLGEKGLRMLREMIRRDSKERFEKVVC